MTGKYICRACQDRGPDERVTDPRCAFANEQKTFQADNWCCATIDQLRDLCYEGQAQMPRGVDYQYCEDQKYASINVDHVELAPDERIGLCLWLTWYKSRGTTDELWLLSPIRALAQTAGPAGAPRAPTEAEVLAVIASYTARQ